MKQISSKKLQNYTSMYYTLMYNLYICIDQLNEKAMKSPFQYGTMVNKCFHFADPVFELWFRREYMQLNPFFQRVSHTSLHSCHQRLTTCITRHTGCQESCHPPVFPYTGCKRLHDYAQFCLFGFAIFAKTLKTARNGNSRTQVHDCLETVPYPSNQKRNKQS